MHKNRTYRTFAEVEEDSFQKHPEEIDDYLTISMPKTGVRQPCYHPCA